MRICITLYYTVTKQKVLSASKMTADTVGKNSTKGFPTKTFLCFDQYLYRLYTVYSQGHCYKFLYAMIQSEFPVGLVNSIKKNSFGDFFN